MAECEAGEISEAGEGGEDPFKSFTIYDLNFAGNLNSAI